MAKSGKPSYPSREQLSARSATSEAEGAKPEDFAATTLDRPVVPLEDVLALAAREEQRKKSSPSTPAMPAARSERPRIAWRVVVIGIAICALAGALAGVLIALLS